MKSLPSLLFLSSVIPLESGNGASMRCGMALEALAGHYQITLVVASQNPQIQEDALPESMRSLCARVWIRGLGRSDGTESAAARIRALPGNVQWATHALWPKPLDLCWVPDTWLRELKGWLAQQEFAGVHTFRLSMMQLATPLVADGVPIVLDLDDIESKAMLRLARLQRADLGRMMYLVKRLEVIKTARAERVAVGRASCVLVCSDSDRLELARRFDRAKLAVLPNAVRRSAQLAFRAHDGAFRVLFVGSLDYAPNQDAVALLANGLAAKITSAVPQGVSWRIVGRRPSEALINLIRAAGMALVADAPDMRGHYDWADAVIVPIRTGGGTRIKILEALSLGRPVVSSTIGAEGLSLASGKDILIADTDEEYAEEFAHLANDREMCEKLVHSGRAAVEECYSLAKISGQLLAVHARAEKGLGGIQSSEA